MVHTKHLVHKRKDQNKRMQHHHGVYEVNVVLVRLCLFSLAHYFSFSMLFPPRNPRALPPEKGSSCNGTRSEPDLVEVRFGKMMDLVERIWPRVISRQNRG